jgi:hypothetical protein
MSASGWFDIEDSGWIRQQAGRPMEEIVRELVQNAFDAARSQVTIAIGREGRETRISVEDDGEGFVNPALAYTVFLSGKADDPTRRGRKGRGLKEAIAAASEARVECVYKTVAFEKSGRARRRVEEKSDRERGTRVELVNSRWTADDVGTVVAGLRTYEPPAGVAVTIARANFEPRVLVPHELVHALPARLQTVVIKDEIEVRETRLTTVRLLKLRDDEIPLLMELGIPVCEWEGLPWHVDVQQRIPLPDHRSTVPLAWERKLKTAILDAMAPELGAAGLKAEWVSTVLSDAAPWTQAAYVKTVYGSNVAVKTVGDQEANAEAEELLGKHVVDTRHLPASVRDVLREHAPTTRQCVKEAQAGDTDSLPGPDEAPNPEQPADAPRRVRLEPRADELRVISLTAWMASEILGRKIDCWIEQDVTVLGKRAVACWTGSAIIWSRFYSGKGRMEDPFSHEVLSTIVHEIAHGLTPTWGHGPDFHDAVERCAGRVAQLLILRSDEARWAARAGNREAPRAHEAI